MGINHYSVSLNVIAKHKEIFQAVQEWLEFNEFVITEFQDKYLKAQRGKYLALFDRNLRRYIEIMISDGFDFTTILIKERVNKGDMMAGNIIKEEVLSLKDFLEKKLKI